MINRHYSAASAVAKAARPGLFQTIGKSLSRGDSTGKVIGEGIRGLGNSMHNSGKFLMDNKWKTGAAVGAGYLMYKNHQNRENKHQQRMIRLQSGMKTYSLDGEVAKKRANDRLFLPSSGRGMGRAIISSQLIGGAGSIGAGYGTIKAGDEASRLFKQGKSRGEIITGSGSVGLGKGAKVGSLTGGAAGAAGGAMVGGVAGSILPGVGTLAGAGIGAGIGAASGAVSGALGGGLGGYLGGRKRAKAKIKELEDRHWIEVR